MRKYAIVLFSLMFVSAFVFRTAAQTSTPDKPPAEIVFKAKIGDVKFPHAQHANREKKCDTCHDKVFPKDSKAPLNYKAGMHKPAEKDKTSCATCHVAQGKSFETKGNCAKCHKK